MAKDSELREQLIERIVEKCAAVDLRGVAENESTFYLDLLADFVLAHTAAQVAAAVQTRENEIGYLLHTAVDNDIDNELEASDVVAKYDAWRLAHLATEQKEQE